MPRYDVVIAGAGHNGLVAAACLARAGRSVLVLERSARPGGAAAVLEEIERALGGFQSGVAVDDRAMLALRFIAPAARTAPDAGVVSGTA